MASMTAWFARAMLMLSMSSSCFIEMFPRTGGCERCGPGTWIGGNAGAWGIPFVLCPLLITGNGTRAWGAIRICCCWVATAAPRNGAAGEGSTALSHVAFLPFESPMLMPDIR